MSEEKPKYGWYVKNLILTFNIVGWFGLTAFIIGSYVMQKLRMQAVGICFELQKTQILAVRENYLRQTDRRFRRVYCVCRNPATKKLKNGKRMK